MDPEEFRAILSRSRIGIWELIEAAIKVASSDHNEEFHIRRDKIVESLYAPAAQLCRNCNGSLLNDDGCGALDEPYYPQAVNNSFNISDDIENNINCDAYNDDIKKLDDDDDNNKRNMNEDHSDSPLTPESNHRNISGGEEEEDVDPYGGLFDDEQTKILSIKEQLEDPQQSDDDVVQLLQNLEDMDITFQALKETDIGRHVNRLRKHPSNEVRGLVKQLVRRWKDIVDEWVKVNEPKATSDLMADGDSPHQSIPRNQQNHHQVPDFGYSPNPQNGSSTVGKNVGEQYETMSKTPKSATRKVPLRPPQSIPKSASAPTNRVPRESVVDDERLNSARRRLQENYQEAQNAKKQRTIQVMDIHEIPKPKAKNAFFAKNKGGGFQGRNHR